MPISNLTPYSLLCYSGAVVTATVTPTDTQTAASGAWQMANDIVGGQFILDQGTGTGTSPTLDVAIQTSPDFGVTYYTQARFAQVTTTAAKLSLIVSFRPTNAAAVANTITAGTGGALTTNFPSTKYMRVLLTIGGTNPSYATIKVWFNGWRTGGGDV